MTESVTEGPGRVSIDLTRQLMQHAREQGVPVDDLLALHGFSLEPLPDHPAFIDADQFERLLAVGLRSVGDPLPGLAAARWQVASIFGLAGFLAQTASTVGALLQVLPQIESLLGNVGFTRVVREPGEMHLVLETRFVDPYVRRNAVDFMLSVQSWGIQTLTEASDSTLTAVHLEHDAPADTAQARRYVEAFGCPVYFSQPTNRLIMPIDVLNRRLVSADPVVHQMLSQHVSKLIEERRQSVTFADVCRSTLHHLLHQGRASREALAEALEMSSRSLHRKLADEGTSYREVYDELRLERVRGLLRDQGMTLQDVAVAAGFDEVSSFKRWFRQMTGVSPTAFREERAAE